MAAFTSKATGNWSAAGQTTWNEVGVPGNGDTVTIGTGHNITVDVNTTVGHSPGASDPTMAIDVNTTGTLIIGTSVTLVCRGDMRLNNTTVTMNAGAILEFDASQAGVPATALYFLRMGTGHSQTACKLTANGTAGNHCTIRSNSGGGFARITSSGFIGTANLDCTYTDFLRMGASGSYSILTSLDAAGNICSLVNCSFDTCGKLTGANAIGSATWRVQDTTWKNTTDSRCATFTTATALTTGVRSVTGCVFDTFTDFFSMQDWTISNTLFYLDYIVTDITGGWASFTNNLVRGTNATTMVASGNTTNCYSLQNHVAGNPHFLQPTINRNVTIDGWVFEYTSTDFDGDCIVPSAPASGKVYTIKNCLVLPNSADAASGTVFSLLGSVNVTLSCEHCTVSAKNSVGASVGETYIGHAGLVSSFKSNLFWSPTALGGYKMTDSGTDDSVPDLVSSANADYNGGWNLIAGSNLKGYDHLEFSSGSPGAHDVVDANPTFVDSDRDMAKWDLSLGGPGTVVNALAELKKRNDAAGYNSNYTIAALLTYVKAGFAPRNTVFFAAHDSVSPSNGWIGAVEGAGIQSHRIAGTIAPIMSSRRRRHRHARRGV